MDPFIGQLLLIVLPVVLPMVIGLAVAVAKMLSARFMASLPQVKQDELHSLVEIAVQAAEQAFASQVKAGQLKKDMVLSLVLAEAKRRGIPVTEEWLGALIEVVVRAINTGMDQSPLQAPDPAVVPPADGVTGPVANPMGFRTAHAQR
jgi:hypothetical protein